MYFSFINERDVDLRFAEDPLIVDSAAVCHHPKLIRCIKKQKTFLTKQVFF
jgi:hypothetical protein